MDFLGYFGDFLAEKLGKDPISVRGLIRIAIKDLFNGKIPQELDFSTLQKVFDGPLRNHLITLGIPNSNEIIKELIDILIKRQSMFTLAQILYKS